MEWKYILCALLAAGMAGAGAWLGHRARGARRGKALPAAGMLAAAESWLRGPDGEAAGEQSARRIRRFWCYRTREQTLLFVRLRSGRLYCFYMGREGKGEGARWVVRRAECDRNGDITRRLKQLRQGA